MVSINLAAPATMTISARVVICIPPHSAVSMEMVASVTIVFQVVIGVQPLLVVFTDAAATAVVEMAAFVTVVRPIALCNNNVSVGNQSKLQNTRSQLLLSL